MDRSCCECNGDWIEGGKLMSWDYTNDYSSTLSSGYTAGATSLILASVTGLPVSGRYFILKCENEYFLCTSYSGTTLTVVGAQAGSAAANHASAAAITGCWILPSVLDGIREDQSQVGTFANLPTGGMKRGDRYKCTDSCTDLFYTGSVWSPFILGVPVILPNSASFAWTNQSGASVSSITGPLVITIPNANSGAVILDKALPSTPYTITVGMKYLGESTYGIILRDSSSGKFVWIRFTPNGVSGPAVIFLDKWNSATSENSLYFGPINISASMTDVVYFRFVDSAGTRAIYVSTDGFNFMKVHSIGNTDFMTPNRVGFAAYNIFNGLGASNTYNTFLSIVHYLEQ
jgi:hypothetical protein